MSSPVLAIARREFASYFATPLALVFLVIFLMLAAVLPFYQGNFFSSGQATLQAFFAYHPILYLVLVPAVSMRLWAEERQSGTIELLLTQPLALRHAVLGKFLAAWAFIAFALALTFPMWITVEWLGEPDRGVIVASYLASWLMAGAYLAIGGCLSAATRSQVIAYILTLVIILVMLLAGNETVLDWVRLVAPQGVVDAVAQVSFASHFGAIVRGVLELRDLAFFALTIGAWLVATMLVIELKKAD
jgi:ABC-2 type transport system permease protein